MLKLLGWPAPAPVPAQNEELYVSRETYYWMVNPPYLVPTVKGEAGFRLLYSYPRRRRSFADDLPVFLDEIRQAAHRKQLENNLREPFSHAMPSPI
jgi:hypothetical protein